VVWTVILIARSPLLRADTVAEYRENRSLALVSSAKAEVASNKDTSRAKIILDPFFRLIFYLLIR